MRKKLKVYAILLLTLATSFAKLPGIDSLKYGLSLNFYEDLSDTYLGGRLLSGEFIISHSWYGGCFGYGHFISQPTFINRVTIEEINKTFEIPIEEMAIMQMGFLSGYFSPIKNRWLKTDILLGLALAKAKYLTWENVFYEYNFIDNRFNYLYIDNQLVKKTHFGYQVGLNITFFPEKKAGIQLSSRIQHLNNGGSFFFVGGGLCFRL